jgi:hypothetical protein
MTARDAESGPPVDLEEFLRILPHLDVAELLAIGAAYQATDAETREAARSEASATAKRRGLDDEIRRVQGSIIQWANSDIARSQTLTFENVRASSSMLGDVRQDNVPPLLDAATALVLGDALDTRSRDLLLGPFIAAVEEPS